MNNKLLLFSLILNLIIYFNNGEIFVEDVTVNKILFSLYSNNILEGEPEMCNLDNIQLLITDTISTIVSIKSLNDTLYNFNFFPKLKNSTSVLYQISAQNYPQGLNPFQTVITNDLGDIMNYNLNVNCLAKPTTFAYSSLVVDANVFGQIGGIFEIYDPINTQYINKLGSGGTFYYQGKNQYYFLTTIYSIPFESTMTLSNDQVLNFGENNYVNTSTYDNVFDINTFNLIGDYKVMGDCYAPVFVFSSNSTDHIPYFSMSVNGWFNSNLRFRPIGTQGSNTQFIGLFDYFMAENQINNYVLRTHNKSITLSNVFSLKLNITGLGPFTEPKNGAITHIGSSVLVEFQISLGDYYNEYIPTLYCSFKDQTHYNVFPFGFIYGGVNHLSNYSASFPLVTYNMESSIFLFVKDESTNSEFLYKTNVLTSAPLPTNYNDFEFIHLYEHFYLVRINVSSPDPIYRFKVGENSYTPTGLISGTLNNGVFEFIFNTFNSFNNIYVNQFTQYFSPGLIINSYSSLENLKPFWAPPLLKNEFNILNVTSAFILFKSMNVSNTISGNILYFNYSNIDVSTPISMLVDGPVSVETELLSDLEKDIKNKLYRAQWNSTIQMFQVEFFLPKNSRSSNRMPYALFFRSNLWVLNSNFGEDAQFSVISNNGDMFGPIFEKIQRFPSVLNSITQPLTMIGWNLTISDPINGFSGGWVSVVSSIDGSTYNFTIVPPDPLNIYNFQFSISIPVINSCITQQYIITDVYMIDTEDNISTFSIYQKERKMFKSLYNPFINYISDRSINRISIECTYGQVDQTPPTISNLHRTDVLDVGLVDRSVFVNFTSTDPDTGIKKDSLPRVYLQTVDFDVIEAPCVITDELEFSTSYHCETIVPVGFGNPFGIFPSIYGLVNNGGYYGGYKSDDIGGKINITYSLNYPIIINSQKISTKGGNLWLTGKGFKSVLNATLRFNNGTETMPRIDNKIGESAIYLLNIPSMETGSSFIIYLSTSSLKSNEYIIKPYEIIEIVKDEQPTPTPSPSNTSIPTPTPTHVTEKPSPTPPVTNPPQRCIGEPQCGGPNKGYCISGVGCVCYSPWIGDGCQNQIIIIPPPPKNNSNPSTIIDIPDPSGGVEGSGSSLSPPSIIFKSIISLISIREIDFDGNIVINHVFDKWIFNEIDQYTSEYHTNLTNNEFNTPIQTTIQWFINETSLEFANQPLIMKSSSIKYTIFIGNYKFQKSLNSLELVMSASLISTKTDDICSNQEFGDTTNIENSNYLKISVGDHSLYGRFIKRGLVDNKVISIGNKIINDDYYSSKNINTEFSSLSFIAISIPQFQNNVTIDPDFSILLSHQSDSSNGICSKSNGLNTGAIIGIAVGCFAFTSVIVISVIYYFWRKKQQKLLLLSISKKLNKIQNNQ